MSSPANEKASKPRHRASVACATCRERRTRCVIQPGEESCTQCLDNGQECIIKNDDQRRKPVSKAYVNLLQDKISHLEAELRRKENRPQTAGQELDNEQAGSPGLGSGAAQHTQPESASFAVPAPRAPEPAFSGHRSMSARGPGSPSDSTPSSGDSSSRGSLMVHKLLSTRGHVSYDQLAGRLRYFGPTTNCHIHSNIAPVPDESQRQATEQERRTQRVLSALPQATHDYLMDCFWRHYNSVIHVVNRKAFEEGKDIGGGPFYSGFLHICILAAGYRFADKQRPDIRGITLAERESTLHREAKYMLDYEMERPGGVPSIGALLLLGDLEVGCGRDNAGWLYSGMAYRLCFDVGLHLDRSGSGLSQEDIEIGYMTLWACVIYDRYWALFLGRPTALKPDDLEVLKLSQQFDRLGTGQSPGPEKSPETQVYQALLDLMELGAKITDTMDNVPNRRANSLDRLVYLRVAALDSELEKWYARLPPGLQYTAENIETAPFSFFLLHQQYYSTMILLHRQFAGYDDILDGSSERKATDRESTSAAHRMSSLSRDTCTTCAKRIAQIFWQHRRRFDTRRIFVTGLQHAGNAATALVAAIVSSTDRASNDKNMRHLECLTAVMKDMAETYQPAERMAVTFNVVLQELRDLQPDRRSPSSVPARRGSSADCEEGQTYSPSKRSPFSRLQPSTQPTAPVSFPDGQFRRRSEAAIPSPAPTSQLSEKPTGPGGENRYGMTNEGFVVVDGDMPDIDHSWPVFSGLDGFGIEDDMAGQPCQPCQPSPLGFSPIWAGNEASFFSSRTNNATVEPDGSNGGFMVCPDGPGRTTRGTESSDGSNSMSLISNDRTDTGIPGMPGLSPDAIDCNGLSSSSSNDRTRGNQSARWKPSNVDARYTEGLARPDSIWNEIIS